MPPRILIFVGLSGDGPRADAGMACTLAPAGSARLVTLDPALAETAVRRASDRLAEDLNLRPVAWEIAVLARVTDLLRERPDALVVIDAVRPAALLRVIEAADLARARLDAGRPAASTSSLSAQRQARAPELPLLRAAAAAGDVLRAPELTTVGLHAGPASGGAAEIARARTGLAFAGLALLPNLLPDDPEAAAKAAFHGGGAHAALRDPSPVTTATPRGAKLRLVLPDVPDDLRAVRSGSELALHAAGLSRRLVAPGSLGSLAPEGVEAGTDGSIVATFVQAAEPAA